MKSEKHAASVLPRQGNEEKKVRLQKNKKETEICWKDFFFFPLQNKNKNIFYLINEDLNSSPCAEATGRFEWTH